MAANEKPRKFEMFSNNFATTATAAERGNPQNLQSQLGAFPTRENLIFKAVELLIFWITFDFRWPTFLIRCSRSLLI